MRLKREVQLLQQNGDRSNQQRLILTGSKFAAIRHPFRRPCYIAVPLESLTTELKLLIDARIDLMSDDQPKLRTEADAKLEQEIRDGRKFSLAEAIGRMAGPGMMKGVSPATRKQQTEAEIASFLDRSLHSPAGALSVVLFRRIKESELLLSNYDQPLIALAGYVQETLNSEYVLQELVRECDVEWGQAFGERPFFEKAGCPPHQDDPYTVESVRTLLCQLLEKVGSNG